MSTRYLDPYAVNLRTEPMIKQLFKNRRFDQLLFDNNLKFRLGYKLEDDNTDSYWLYTNGSMGKTSWKVNDWSDKM